MENKMKKLKCILMIEIKRNEWKEEQKKNDGECLEMKTKQSYNKPMGGWFMIFILYKS